MAFYDSYAARTPTRAGRSIMERLSRRHVERLDAMGGKGRRLAEIGPGQGDFARTCADRHVEYVAIEPNERIAEMVRSMGHEVVVALAPPIPLPDASVGVVHAAHVLEHSATYREALQLVAEARRVVAPGGLVSIVVPDFDHLGPEFYRYDYSHAFPVNLTRLVQLMEDSGLAVAHTEYLSGPFGAPARWFTQAAARRLPVWMLRCMTLGRLTPKQCVAVKTTFMRAVWVVGRRPAAG
jgi:SAM-dependent methyltransferase